MAKSKSFRTHIDLPADQREKLVALINQQLADTFDLYSQVKHAHWNVKGPQFIMLHELFDKLAEELEDEIDDIAERATTLGGMALGTARMTASATRVAELPADLVAGLRLVDALVERYAAVAASTRAAIEACNQLGDADTADLFTQVSRELDKSLWFLEAHVQE